MLRLILAILWSILVAGLTGAYPSLNPAHFNGPAALAAFILAAAAALAAHIYVGYAQAQTKIVESTLVGRVKTIENRLGMGDTHSLPATGPQAINLPQRPPRDD